MTSAAVIAEKNFQELFSPVRIGKLDLPNRLVMAPLTRLRAGTDGVPGDLLVEHYRQRATMGLIITEGTCPVSEGRTWIGQPGIETREQARGWKKVTDAVHADGGRIVMQIMHGGRVSHPQLTGTGRIVAPSPLPGPHPIRLPGGKAMPPVPHALDAREIQLVIGQFVTAAKRAVDAGMDGVEIHGANGYLVHQFLSPAANIREDHYGGSSRNRARFAIELVAAVAEAVGPEHTAIRLSPAHPIQNMAETDPADTQETYCAFAEGVAPLGLAFIDILHDDPASTLVQSIRARAGAPLIANTGFSSPTPREEAASIVAAGLAEAVSVGRPAIANPDLVGRWQRGIPENRADPATFYTTGPQGYTDYPTMHQQRFATIAAHSS